MIPRKEYLGLTGRYRLAPHGDHVRLQVEYRERSTGGFGSSVNAKWGDATPQDVASLVTVQIEPAAIKVA